MRQASGTAQRRASSTRMPRRHAPVALRLEAPRCARAARRPGAAPRCWRTGSARAPDPARRRGSCPWSKRATVSPFASDRCSSPCESCSAQRLAARVLDAPVSASARSGAPSPTSSSMSTPFQARRRRARGLLLADVDHEAGQAVVEDAGREAALEISLDDVVEHAGELRQAPRLRPARERRHAERQHEPDGHRHAVEAQGMRSGRAERQQLLISREPSHAELHPEHERERHRDDEEVRRERGGDPDQIAQRTALPKTTSLSCRSCRMTSSCRMASSPTPERHQDFAQHEAVEEVHSRAL